MLNNSVIKLDININFVTMRLDQRDKTLEKNYIQRYISLIREYEVVKSGNHKFYKFAKDFYSANNIVYKTFLKYYNRFKQEGRESDLLPRKRGPRYKTRRTLKFIESKIVDLRNKGNSRYEIYQELKPNLKGYTPSTSTIYNVCKRYNLNRLNEPMKDNRRKIVKEKCGEMGHIDCHYLRKGIVRTQPNKRYFLVGVIDDCSRLVWVEIVENVQGLTVMFAVLRSFNMFKQEFDIRFEEVLTDNGAEFGGNVRGEEGIMKSPFKRMLVELGIKHRVTRPYRPQTNGKIERFWKTIEEDLIENTDFDSIEELRDELMQYLVYYNYGRAHQAIDGKTPFDFKNLLPK
jgi:transposase InsO family protein